MNFAASYQENKLTRLKDLKGMFPQIKTMCFVGNIGTGKTLLTQSVAQSLPAYAYHMDEYEIIKFFQERSSEIPKLIPAKKYPDFNDPESIVAFYLANVSKSKEAFLKYSTSKSVLDFGEKKLCEDMLQNHMSNPISIEPAPPTDWLSTGGTYVPTQIEPRVHAIDSYLPGREVLEQADRIYKLSTFPQDKANLAAAKRQGIRDDELGSFLKRARIVNEAVEEVLAKDLQGLEYTQLVNNHEKGEVQNLTSRVVKEYYRDFY